MNLGLGELVVDFESLGRKGASLFASGTPRIVLAATAAAKMLHGDPSLRQIIEVSGLPSGTLKASRSRVKGLREAMGLVGRGPLDYFAPGLHNEIAVLRSFWRWRTPAQAAAWEAAAGCLDGIHSVWHAYADAGMTDPYVDPFPGEDLMEWLPEREKFERLWGENALGWIEWLDIAHMLSVDPPAWAA